MPCRECVLARAMVYVCVCVCVCVCCARVLRAQLARCQLAAKRAVAARASPRAQRTVLLRSSPLADLQRAGWNGRGHKWNVSHLGVVQLDPCQTRVTPSNKGTRRACVIKAQSRLGHPKRNQQTPLAGQQSTRREVPTSQPLATSQLLTMAPA
jgi:hypothetical protein